MIGTSVGTIRVASVAAFNNGTEGISLINTDSLTGGIFMTGTNIANNNGREGLDIETNGAVSLTNLEASYNGYSSGGTSNSVDIVAGEQTRRST